MVVHNRSHATAQESGSTFLILISGGAFVLLLVFLIVGLLVALYELMSEIKNEPQHGPVGRALKEAFCGCLPPLTR